MSDSDDDALLLALVTRSADVSSSSIQQPKSNDASDHALPDAISNPSQSIDFSFPYTPYSVQTDLMRAVYKALDAKVCAVIESPTGTGKSLSLLCSSLTWLERQEKCREEALERILSEQQAAAEDDDWLGAGYERGRQLAEEADKETEWRRRLEKRRHRVKKAREGGGDQGRRRKRKPDTDSTTGVSASAEEDDDLLISDEEPEESRNEDVQPPLTKVYICSRTHSQLAQLVAELRKTRFASTVSCVSLASRQSLCVNDAVRRLRSSALMNERCLEMQKNSGKIRKLKNGSKKKRGASCKCPFYKQENIEELADAALATVTDIESLVESGRTLQACPYYATRHASADAQLVLLPYQSVLHRSTREASGIDLRDSILIIDEAHNLIDTINAVHSAQISHEQLSLAHTQVSNYVQRFQNRLKASNILQLKQLLMVLSCLQKIFSDKSDTDRACSTAEFIFEVGLDGVNLFRLLRYLEASKVCRKLSGYSERYSSTKQQNNKEQSVVARILGTVNEVEHTTDAGTRSTSPMVYIQNFLECLTRPVADGRVIVGRSNSTLRYINLNPATHFKDIVDQTRSVIFAGGTMEPVSEIRDQLLGGSFDLQHFTCGHVISASQLRVLALSHGPSNCELNFTYHTKNDVKLLEDLSNLVLDLCRTVPHGLVCFLPSYNIETQLVTFWRQNGTFYDRINAQKRIFREPKSTAEVDTVLGQYAAAIEKHSGALLLAVVGGKLSEGINFADKLGRCVIMIGMPYPNLKSIELQERMRFLNATQRAPKPNTVEPGQQLYESLCMKAVSQSIGRAIRHKGDYACIVLADARFQRSHIRNALPTWVQPSVRCFDSESLMLTSMEEFFKSQEN